ncbi:CO/xanthine dehydrogenase Mo-binding subunit [Thermosporothrix hazakensis]|uniref:CO/xanthine dehydrogenase Mo-binding subunit n=2 Tax=Thermosporothrix TaxID=768650 RepID=A0A326U8J6_THEHA|nr:xanthine dehydrogenase family protein molybdopterin-binding subunit [Thermosporothrix hazakensis]PZW30575.1 CO/xanthine dehydrogenase Mo-binding subunit [Thermosporothrix hazakensis]BBH91290.1 xanthine dehydrogenase [Thermosporothrix sp. COM3]GCE49437.1 xanthine dehydrogenase [Thermosporothrix hazakensis]
MTQTVDPNTDYRAVGRSTNRLDGLEKVTGRTRYAGDITAYGMLHVRLVLSPYAHARIVSIDTAAAEAIPGVVAVFTAKTLEMAGAGTSSRSQSPLALDEACWCGHPVAVVVAESEAAAEDGAAAVEVDYDPLPVVVDPEAALLPDAPLARSRSEDEVSEIAGGGAHAAVSDEGAEEEEEEEPLSQNVSDKAHIKKGDIEVGLREADVVVERTYRTHPVHQSYLEPQSITVVPGPSGLQVWASAQGLYETRSSIAKAINLPERQIHVESVPIGGAFGGKFGLLEPLAGAVAYKLRRPVRLVYTRQEDLLAGNPAPQAVFKLKLGAKRDGTLVALQAKVIFDAGVFPGAAASFGGMILANTYNCPNVDIRAYEVLTNKVSTGAYRAPNAPQSTFALESTVDALCNELGVDKLEFRRKNALREGDMSGFRQRLPRIGLVECIERIQQHPLWQQREQQKTVVPDELKGWKVGIGVAVGGWPGGTESAAAACRLEKDGTFTVVLGTVDLTGSDTSMALIAAEGLGLSVASVNVAHDGTDTMPYSGGTGGSKTIYSMGPAVLKAAQDARRQVLEIAADMLEAAVDDLEIEDGKVVVRGVPSKNVSLEQIANSSMNFGAPYAPVYGNGRSAIANASPMYTAHLVKVAVDPETGKVRVLDYVAAQDVGYAINPAEVEGQMCGGITQGLGWALFEGMEYDENGQLLTPTLMDYALPHSQDVPNITPLLVEVPSGRGPFGAKGVGEPPVVPVAAAVANAIYDAVGARLEQIPMTPERVFTAMQAE